MAASNPAIMADVNEKHPNSRHFEESSQSSNEDVVWDEAEEARIRHKLDWQIVPIVTLMYLLCFLDRSVTQLILGTTLTPYSANIGNARIQGMAKDLKLIGFRFNWASSIFYIVYLLVEVPSNIILKRVSLLFYTRRRERVHECSSCAGSHSKLVADHSASFLDLELRF